MLGLTVLRVQYIFLHPILHQMTGSGLIPYFAPCIILYLSGAMDDLGMGIFICYGSAKKRKKKHHYCPNYKLIHTFIVRDEHNYGPV